MVDEDGALVSFAISQVEAIAHLGASELRHTTDIFCLIIFWVILRNSHVISFTIDIARSLRLEFMVSENYIEDF